MTKCAVIVLQKRFLLVIASEQSERGNPKVNLRLNSWIATQILQKFVRNGKKAFSLNFSFSVQVQISLEVSASRAVA